MAVLSLDFKLDDVETIFTAGSDDAIASATLRVVECGKVTATYAVRWVDLGVDLYARKGTIYLLVARLGTVSIAAKDAMVTQGISTRLDTELAWRLLCMKAARLHKKYA